ncbi:MAG: response regulator [Bacteroidales bacterium]|nr:response regulator [Bacteroidales bacterium]
MQIKGSVLIIEESFERRNFINNFLKKEGYYTCPVDSGVNAIATLATIQTDIILLGFNPINSNSFDVLKSLKKDKSLKQIPVLICTNEIDDIDISEAKKLGAVGVISTQLADNAFFKIIDQFISASKINEKTGLISEETEKLSNKKEANIIPLEKKNNKEIVSKKEEFSPKLLNIVDDANPKIKNKWEQTINSIDDILIIINKDFIIEDINIKGLELLKKTKREVVGKKCFNVIHNVSSPKEFCPICKSVLTKETEIVEHYGEIFGKWFSLKSSPVFDEKGEIVKYIDIMRDISVLKDIENLAKKQKKEYQSLNEELKQTNEELLLAKEKAEASRIKYKAAFHTSPDAVNINKLDGEYVEISEGFTKLTGYTKEEVIGKLSSDINIWIIPEDRVKLVDALKKDGVIENLESVFKAKDGTLITALMSAKIIKLNDQPHILSVTREITKIKEYERKLIAAKEIAEKNEKRLIETETRFSKLFQNMSSGVAVYKPLDEGKDFKFIDFNEAAERITNTKKENVIGKKLLHVFPKMDKTPLFKTLQEVYKTGNEVHIEPFYYKDDIREGWRENSVYKLSTGEIVAIFHDVSERIIAKNKLIEQNQELIIAKEKAENSDRLKTEFLNNLSHEIRTPLNGILGFSELLTESNLTNEKRTSYFNIVQSSSSQLVKVIDDILEISKLTTKQAKTIELEVCLNDLFVETLNEFGPRAKENNINLTLKKGLRDKEATIFSDDFRLNRILNNLVDNAIKYTNVGTIEIGYFLKNNFIEIYVKDTGIGIKKENQTKVFEAFSQEDEGISRKFGGLGLGLAIAKANTELLGGEIYLISEKDKGSVFTVKLPYKPVYLLNDTSLNHLNKNSKQKTVNILVVEDEEINFLYLETLLEANFKFECNIIHASNGIEAVEICQKDKSIDLILMDLKMPILSGFDATKQIKLFSPYIPIIAQTAYVTTEDKQKAMFYGCDDVITKPIKKEELNNILEKHLNPI